MDVGSIGAHVTRIGGKFMDSASKTKDNLKIEVQIRELQNELTDAYRMLGFLYYEKMKGRGESENATFDTQSQNLIAEIDNKSSKIEALLEEKSMVTQKHCGKCGKPVSNDSAFCSHCGESFGK